jgi:hypothetical protein
MIFFNLHLTSLVSTLWRNVCPLYLTSHAVRLEVINQQHGLWKQQFGQQCVSLKAAGLNETWNIITQYKYIQVAVENHFYVKNQKDLQLHETQQSINDIKMTVTEVLELCHKNVKATWQNSLSIHDLKNQKKKG